MQKKIKIAVNARFLIPNKLEGIGTYSHQVLSRLVKLLPNIEFHFLFDRPFSKEYIYAENVVPHQIGLPARHPFLWYLWFEFSIPKWLKKNKVDYFISPDSFLSLNSNVKTLLVMHDLAFEHFPNHNGFLVRNFYKYFFPKYAQKANSIIAVSKFTKKDIIEKYQISENKIEIGYCGVSEVYQPIKEDEQKEILKIVAKGNNYFICIGSLNPRKNISTAIRAFNLYKAKTNNETKLLIVGAEGWKTDKLFKEINLSPYQNEIIKTGHLRPEILSKYLASAKGLIFPSLFEGFGIPIVEAAKCNIPVITSNISSTKEVGQHLARLVSPLDAEAIMQEMIFIDNNKENVVKNREKSKKLILYNWDKTALKFRDIILNNLP